MASPPDYEPSIAPASFVASWRERLRSQLQQIPSHSSVDDDCPYEYEEQPLSEDAYNRSTNDFDCPRVEDYSCVPSCASVAPSDLDNLQRSPEVSVALAGTMIRQ